MGKPVALLALALFVATIAVAVLAVGSMREDSATADEAAHIAAGLLKVREGRIDVYSTQTPLIEMLIATPLAMNGYRVPEVWERYGNRPWVAGELVLHRAGYDSQRILRMARLPVIAMLIALCFAVWAFVRDATGNDVAAIGGFVLTGFCPTLLAHGRLATVDMGVTLFGFVATWLLLRLLRAPSVPLAILFGVAVACTLAAKVSGALFVPFFVIVVVMWWRRGRQRHQPARTPALLVAIITCIVVFAAIYLGHPEMYLDQVRAVRSFYTGNPLPQFLLGEFSQEGWPHYYLVAMAVKTPLPALMLLAIGLSRTRKFEAVLCVLFAVLFMAVSAFSSLNLGIRHILPIYPFLYAACAISLAVASRKLQITAGVLVVAHALSAVIAYPSYISYFNPLIGSHRNADRVLIDSNLDWGQDLRRLATWARLNDVEQLRVHYFGAGSVERELGARGVRWPAPRREPLPRGWFAVSRHFYRLSFLPARSPMDYDTYLRASAARYVTTIGGSLDVYRVQ
ncbi:MAG TPA: glycosyltransferase family 39 protein [Thermoanaerobaculia bacterium]|nr:glycosyltransferase family 39 protein [Thermoanaerobaculia bacterium]